METASKAATFINVTCQSTAAHVRSYYNDMKWNISTFFGLETRNNEDISNTLLLQKLKYHNIKAKPKYMPRNYLYPSELFFFCIACTRHQLIYVEMHAWHCSLSLSLSRTCSFHNGPLCIAGELKAVHGFYCHL